MGNRYSYKTPHRDPLTTRERPKENMNNSAPMLHVLVEDDSLAEFLNHTLELTALRSVSVEIIPCGGWNGVFIHYESLVQSGLDPNWIVPIFDADTIEEHLPRKRSVLDNQNLLRLSYDLEFAFENWMLAEALLKLQFSPFGDDQSPRNYLACENEVQHARSISIQEGRPLYLCLVQCFRDEYARQGNDRTTFVPPSKMKLSKAIAEIVLSTREFPQELALLVKHLESIAKTLGLALTPSEMASNSMMLHRDAIMAAKLSGKVLVSILGQRDSHLWILDLDKCKLHQINNNREISYASWSPNGTLIAGSARMHDSPEHKRRSVLIIEENGAEKGWVSTRTSIGSESLPCWWPDGQSLLLRTDKGTCKASYDSKHWKQLYPNETAYHCISRNGQIVRTIYRDNRYYIEIGSSDGNEPYYTVPDTTDVRSAVSWSPSGRYIAFANHTNINNYIGAVCFHDCRTHTTKFLTSHYGFPYFICFSPDERSILFSWRDHQGHSSLRVVNIESRKVSILLDGVPSELVFGCHAWHSANE